MARTSCTYEIVGRRTSLRQRYDSTDVNQERDSSVDVPALKVYYALYHLGNSNFGFTLLI